MNQTNAMAVMNCAMSGLSIQSTAMPTAGAMQTGVSNGMGAWDYWTTQYYPQVIHQSYPVYYQVKAMDKGKQAFEILKSLMDKNLVKIDKVKDFVEAMDTILKTI